MSNTIQSLGRSVQRRAGSRADSASWEATTLTTREEAAVGGGRPHRIRAHHLWRACLAAALLPLAAAPATASSPLVEGWSARGDSAWAGTATCVEDRPDRGDVTCRYVDVLAASSRLRDADGKVAEDGMCVTRVREVWDASRERIVLRARHGCMTDASVDVERTGVHAVASVPGESVVCRGADPERMRCSEPRPVDIAADVTWARTGDYDAYRYRERYISSGCASTYVSSEESAPATANGVVDGRTIAFLEATVARGAFRYSSLCR